jgi:WD40 repeat protein
MVVHHEDEISSVDVSNDGTILAVGSDDHEVSLWDAQSKRRIHRFNGHGEQIGQVCFSPDGSQLCTTGADNNAKLWDLTELMPGSSAATRYKLHSGNATGVGFADGGASIWSCASRGDLHKWDAATLELKKAFELPENNNCEMGVSRDGRWVGVVAGQWPKVPGRPDTLRIYDSSQEKLFREIKILGRFCMPSNSGPDRIWKWWWLRTKAQYAGTFGPDNSCGAPKRQTTRSDCVTHRTALI